MKTICVVSDVRYFDMAKEEIVSKYFLTEIEQDLDVCEAFKFKDKYYSVSCKKPKDDLIIVHEIKLNEPEELYAEDNIKCPYCSVENRDSWEIGADSGEETCDDCGSKFIWNRNVSVTYNCSPIEQKEIKELSNG